MSNTFFDQAAADYATTFVTLMPASSNGKPLQIIPWQGKALSDFYGTMMVDEEGDTIRAFQYLYLELTKKQGKSEIAAALGVMHMLDPEELNGEVYVIAADRQNADIVFSAACFKIRNTPALARMEKKGLLEVRASSRKITYGKTGTIMRVLSADASTKHGFKPSCVIFDELHAQKKRDLWDVMTFGAGDARRQPVWIVLTTAGDDPDRRTIGWEIHRKAVNIRNARQLRACLDAGEDPAALPFFAAVLPEDLPEECEKLLAMDDPRWYPVLYGLSAMFSDDDDAIAAADIYDEALWKACNPSIGVTVKLSTIRAEARAARQSEADERNFRWLRLNQWIAVKTVGWLPLTIYDKTQWNGDLAQLRGKRCYGGLDLSATTDLTAFVLNFPKQPGLDVDVVLMTAWVPGDDIEGRERRDHANYRDWSRAHFLTICDGDSIDYADVKDRILEASHTYDLKLLGTDPFLSRTITQELMDKGVNVVEIPQTIAGMWPAMWHMDQAIRKHEMLHVHNTAGRYCFGNVRCRSDGNGNMKPMKNLSRGRIDITVAWIIAVAAWLIDAEAPRTLSEAVQDHDWTL